MLFWRKEKEEDSLYYEKQKLSYLNYEIAEKKQKIHEMKQKIETELYNQLLENKSTNKNSACNNCGAPIKSHTDKCEYCGSILNGR